MFFLAAVFSSLIFRTSYLWLADDVPNKNIIGKNGYLWSVSGLAPVGAGPTGYTARKRGDLVWLWFLPFNPSSNTTLLPSIKLSHGLIFFQIFFNHHISLDIIHMPPRLYYSWFTWVAEALIREAYSQEREPFFGPRHQIRSSPTIGCLTWPLLRWVRHTPCDVLLGCCSTSRQDVRLLGRGDRLLSWGDNSSTAKVNLVVVIWKF